ncbi:MAG: hypothetical protein ACREQF_01140, partial [Candidatus Binataceae bacterium]
ASMVASCGSQEAAGGDASAAAPAAATACEPDASKICLAISATSKPSPAVTSMGTPYASSNLPETLVLDIPGGPTIQVMCYYNPQHSALLRAELSAQPKLDDAGVKYLREKKLCRGA